MPSPFLFAAANSLIDLTTVDLVHQYVRLSRTKDDVLIQLCITAASVEWIWRTGRAPEGPPPAKSPFVSPVAYDEVYDGSGSYRQFLRQWPIVSVESLALNGHAASPSTGFGYPGWIIDQGRKSLSLRSAAGQSPLGRASDGRGFTAGTQNVEVLYTAGFTQVPADIVRACTQMVAVNYKRTAWLDQSSETMGSGGTSGTTAYRAWDVAPEIQKVIRNYTSDLAV